ncbi:MAG: hypothetical protein LBM12_00110 [Candidatus Nomurabacteria bacterium]|jgi:hypothetical protein|nr:hypothetical protein [Candidatus Nomurabacteria bacterium]
MKLAARRQGFCALEIQRLADHANAAIWAVLCLANESCAIGDECPTTLRNFLTRNFNRHAQTYAVHINLKTGEVAAKAVLNRCYRNHLSPEVGDPYIRGRILRQLERRLWQYLYETGLTLWMASVNDDGRQYNCVARKKVQEKVAF